MSRQESSLPRMYRIVLDCKAVPANVGAVAARDIIEEFTHRPWHQNVRCEWDGSRLMLQAENDFDLNGLALLDEFSSSSSKTGRSSANGIMTASSHGRAQGRSTRDIVI
jgi:hypothetical protein